MEMKSSKGKSMTLWWGTWGGVVGLLGLLGFTIWGWMAWVMAGRMVAVVIGRRGEGGRRLHEWWPGVFLKPMGDKCGSGAAESVHGVDCMRVTGLQELVFEVGKMTTGRRTPPIPQLLCVSKTCAGIDPALLPTRVVCQNRMVRLQSVIFHCDTNISGDLRIRPNAEVSCEGFSYREDEFILAGSCGLLYEVSSSHLAEEVWQSVEDTGFDVTVEQFGWRKIQLRWTPLKALLLIFFAVLISTVIWASPIFQVVDHCEVDFLLPEPDAYVNIDYFPPPTESISGDTASSQSSGGSVRGDLALILAGGGYGTEATFIQKNH